MTIVTAVKTILFSDIKDFTENSSIQTRAELDLMLDHHDHILQKAFEDYNGTIIKTIGDAYMVMFDSPTNAVMAGIKIQNRLQLYNKLVRRKNLKFNVLKWFIKEENLTKGSYTQIHVRVGIHTGEVQIKKDDAFGMHVNIAARIEKLALPNSVFFSESVYLAMNKNEIAVEYVGKKKLKGIPEAINIYRVKQEYIHKDYEPTAEFILDVAIKIVVLISFILVMYGFYIVFI